MTPLVPVVMFGWLPLTMGLFARLPPRRAVSIAFIGAWLLLPVASYKVEHLPAFSKLLVTCLGVGLVAVLFDARRLRSLRPRYVDLPMAVVCLSPFVTALVNGQGLFESVSVIFGQVVAWGVPYVIGRLYFDDLDGLRELALAIVIGGLLYVPLCLLEVIVGPVLHPLMYGYSPAPTEGLVRFGGWRPVVFMQSGLPLAVWMAAAAVIALWVWRARVVRHIWKLPMLPAVLALLVAVGLVKSVNGWILAVLGCGLLLVAVRLRTLLPIIALFLVMATYVTVRATGVWDGSEMLPIVSTALNEDRAHSVSFRLSNENIIGAKARERALLGWGRGGEGFVDDQTQEFAIPDSLWIVTFTQFGTIGLAALFGAFVVPVLAFWKRYPVSMWSDPRIAPGAALAIVVCLYMVDNLANGLSNPVFAVVAGALATVRCASGLAPGRRRATRALPFPQPDPAAIAPL